MLVKWEKQEVYRWHFVNRLANHFAHLAFCHSHEAIGIFTHFVNRLANHFAHLAFRHSHQAIGIFTKRLKPAIHLLSNWREREKMLAKQEKWEVYRWHFVNCLASHFSHLAFRRSRQAIGIFTKRQRGRYSKFLVKFLAESKMNENGDIVRSV